MENIVNHAKIYKAEVDRLGQAYADKYSMLELIFLGLVRISTTSLRLL